MARFLSFGSINIDYTYSLHHIVKEGETLASSALTVSAGGKGANQSAALAKSGCEVYHAGRIGKDGLFILDMLESYGVDTRYVDTSSAVSGNAVIQVDENGRNSIIIYGGGNREIRQDMVDDVLSHFSSGDWLVLQNEISMTGYIMKEGRKRGMKICFNPAPFDENVLSLPLETADIICVNEIEGACLAGLDTGSDYESVLRRLMYLHPDTEILLTAGENGAFYGFKGNICHADAVECEVADTTAAGDTFIGYYLACRHKGLSVDIAMNTACMASSLTVSREGAMKSIPFWSEVVL